MLMSGELIKIMHLLEENHIKALAFKGPTLAQMAYGDITLRQFCDLDILIKQEERERASALLASEGYKEALAFTAVQRKNWYKQSKDMILVNSQKGISVEMHWLLLDNDYPVQIDLESIWSHPQSIVINGKNIQTFANESLLLYLCIHGSKHLWQQLEWVKDIDLMIRTRDIEWQHLQMQVEKSGFERMFLLGLYLSDTLFRTPLPATIKQQMHDQDWLISLSDYVINDWNDQQNIFYRSAAMIRLFPTLKMKLLYLHKILIKPSRSEYKFVDLPPGLYWGYYLVRPYLLIKKYLTKD